MKSGILIENITKEEFIELLSKNTDDKEINKAEKEYFDKEFYRVEEAAEKLNIHPGTLRRKKDEGKISFVNGGIIMFKREHLIEYLKNNETKAK